MVKSVPRPSRLAPSTDLPPPTVRPSPVSVAAPSPARWWMQFRRAVFAVDGTVVVVAAAVFWAFGYRHGVSGSGALAHVPVALVAPALILAAAAGTQAWDASVLGHGTTEYHRVGRAGALAAVLLGLAGLAFGSLSVRPWVFGAIPVTTVLLVLGRWLVRRPLHAARRSGRCSRSTLAVGDPRAVRDLVLRTRRDPYSGWVVTGACTPSGTGTGGEADVDGVPVLGDIDDLGAVVRSRGFEVVSVSSGSGLTGARLRRLAWDLEEAGADLIVDPGLMEIAGPRLHVRPVDGFPLLALSRPKLGGVRQVVKTSMDVLGALALLVLVAPVLLLIAVLIRSDGGPVFFRQRRVGLGGTEFQMIKFRSMVPAAEDRLVELAASDTGAGPLFKMRSDPRVTRVGRILRRYSLDELPQLFNVLSGSMSLVGPRPPLPAEVATYGPEAARKFLVKPGMTGLWQVSGRSDLSWEESVRLDLRYVENWSLTGDLVILWKTLHAVLGSHGAY